MAIRLLVTRGFGNGTFDGDIAHVVTRGYGAGAAIVPADTRRDRDAWYGKKRKKPPFPLVHKPKPSKPAEPYEDLNDFWKPAKVHQPEPEILVAERRPVASPEHIFRFKLAVQEFEDEQIVLEAALRYLLD